MVQQPSIAKKEKPPEEIIPLIKADARMLAARYRRQARPIYELLKLLAKDFIVSDSKRGYSCLRIDKYLSHVSGSRLLALLRSEKVDNFTEVISFLQYLENPFTPLYSLEELSQVILQFRSHLIGNRESLEQTGYPRELFLASKWLDSRLNKLFFTKYPHTMSVHNGHVEVAWARESSTTMKREPCNYSDADNLRALKKVDAKRLSKIRPVIHEIKLNILLVLSECLCDRSYEHLWRDSMDVITRRLEIDDLDFLVRMDALYDKNSLTTLGCAGLPDRIGPGGITDIFMVIGHVEQELRLEGLSCIREKLHKYVKGTMGYETRFDVGRFLRNEILSTTERRDSFRDLLRRELKLSSRFWIEYIERGRSIVSVKPATGEAVSTDLATVSERTAAKIYELLKTQADRENAKRTNVWAEQHGPNALVFQLDGDLWRISYMQRTDHFKHAKGFGYIHQLLQFPHSELHVCDLALVRREDTRVEIEDGQIRKASQTERKIGSALIKEVESILDPQATREYRAEIKKLRDGLEEAISAKSWREAAKMRQDLAVLENDLKQSTNLRGRSRRFTDNDERVRQAVGKCIRLAMQKIKVTNLSLFMHMEQAISIGHICCYQPANMPHLTL